MTMMSNLPSDLVEEILSRLPMKYMRSVRFTCKNWNALSKGQTFTKTHIDKVAAPREEEFQMIVMMDYNVYLMSIVVNGTGLDPCKELKGKLTCLDEQVKVSYFLHCEGVLLCILRDDSRLVVWNPYYGQRKWIGSKHTYGLGERYSYSYALGYNKSCRSHKILRFREKFRESKIPNYFSWYEIYDFDYELWRSLDVTPNCLLMSAQHGVSLKGNTYWFAKELHSHRFTNHVMCYIMCFDFTRERFGPLLHLPQTTSGLDIVNLSCVREEKLAALFQPKGSNKIEIWITTEIEAKKVSWSKFLTVDKGPVVGIQISFNVSFLIEEEKKTAVVFHKKDRVRIIGEAGYLREVNLGNQESCWPHACSYVPSSLQIKKPQDGRRKKQSSSKRRIKKQSGGEAKRRKRDLSICNEESLSFSVLFLEQDLLRCW
ncbi:unnamed protein product [Microthlaspi erraticum]|uniref:F-box domain-containing protein n=1 Tax=Microthlaspi erraticum TaxID=1685480 RepID=A0A6D2IZF0_9BRAS|nr:unnamed protein product [Microthlaspi erraticum]